MKYVAYELSATFAALSDPTRRAILARLSQGELSVKELSDAYKNWCEGQGEEPAQGRTFNRMMEERGFERKQTRIHGLSGKAWMGIRLKEHDEIVAGIAVTESPDVIARPGPAARFPVGNTLKKVLVA